MGFGKIYGVSGKDGAKLARKDAKKRKAAKGLLTVDTEDGRHGGGARKDARGKGHKDGGLGEHFIENVWGYGGEWVICGA